MKLKYNLGSLLDGFCCKCVEKAVVPLPSSAVFRLSFQGKTQNHSQLYHMYVTHLFPPYDFLEMQAEPSAASE